MNVLHTKLVFLILNLSVSSLLYSQQYVVVKHLSRENSAENLQDLSPSSDFSSDSLDSLDCFSVSSSIFDSKHLAENIDQQEVEHVDDLHVQNQNLQNQTETLLVPKMEEKLVEKRLLRKLMRYIPTVVVVSAVGYGIHHNCKTKSQTLTIQQQTLKAQQEIIVKQEQLHQQTVQTQKNGIITSAVIAIGGILVRIFIG